MGEQVNYYAARKRKTDGRWDWSRMNDGQIVAAGPCVDHDDGHDTKEGAELHYWEWTTAGFTVHQAAGQQRPCEKCETWTSQFIELADGGNLAFLCPEHTNVEAVRELVPFEAGIQIASSW